MGQILDRLRAYGDFEIVIWGEEITEDQSIPVKDWPVCDCLIAFTSSGFPIRRVKEYVRLRRPYCINDVYTQDIFENRMELYELLEKYGIPTFRHIYADRRGGKTVQVKETDDYIELDGRRMRKPLVEKPFDGGDHNIHIYFSRAQGGGCRKLFRKVKNKSSEFFPGASAIRKDGSYCYEEFITGVKDLKVYTIGPNYAHGEVRKSPAVDGIVARNPDGKEMRLLTLLTPEERDIARRIVCVFQQNICGFDLIRTNGRAYVIDVNGWSFVKGNMRYYDKCARTIRKLCLGALSEEMAIQNIPRRISTRRERVFVDGDNKHTLLSLVTVFRHGDRTPKRKLKLKMTHPEMLWMFKNTKSEVKLKKRKQIVPFLKALNHLIQRLESSTCAPDKKLVPKLRVVRSVIEEDRKGLKIQLKPKKIIEGKVTECLLACKWGGTLTWMGFEQAKFYAPVFWSEMLRAPSTKGSLVQQASEYSMYKVERTGFIKGLQVFAANEARVKSSAKAFIRETLQNEDVPPNTLHSDNKVQEFLDDVSMAHDLIDIAKQQVKKFITANTVLVRSDPRYRPQSPREPMSPDMKSLLPLKTKKKMEEFEDKKSKETGKAKGLSKLNNLVTLSLRALINDCREEESVRPQRKQSRLGKAGLRRQKTANEIIEESNMGSHDLTEWELRCLRWLKVPRNELKALYNQLVELNARIHNHVVESRRKRTPKRGTPVLQGISNTNPPENPGQLHHKQLLLQEQKKMPYLSLGPSPNIPKPHRRSLHLGIQPENDGGGDEEGAMHKNKVTITEEVIKAVENSGVQNDEAPKNPEVNQNDANEELKDFEIKTDAKNEGNIDEDILRKRMDTQSAEDRKLSEEATHGKRPSLTIKAPSTPKFKPLDTEHESDKVPTAGYEDFDKNDETEQIRLYHNETLEELQGRWLELVQDFYDPKTDTFNTTKIPDIYDNIKYDSLHNRHLLTGLRKIYINAKNVANFVIPQEYGVFQTEKLQIGRFVVQNLLQHIWENLLKGMNEDPSHRATLYFSSESHLHSLRNAILLSDIPHNRTVATTLEAMEINYMAHCVFRLFLDPSRPPNDPLRYYVDVQFAPGAALDPFIFMGQDHLLPVSRPIPINGRIPMEKFKQFVQGK